MNMRLLPLSSLLLSIGFANANEQNDTKPQQLKKQLLRIKYTCDIVPKDELKTVVELLQSNPDLQQKYSSLIQEIAANALTKATICNSACNSATLIFRIHQPYEQLTGEAVLMEAKEHFICAENCKKVYKKFKKLSEEK